jgi:hypothetical protein
MARMPHVLALALFALSLLLSQLAAGARAEVDTGLQQTTMPRRVGCVASPCAARFNRR